jgi:hypothetical protein
MLYVGNYMHASNVEAVEYLLQEIWPRVRALGTAARLFMAGSTRGRLPSRSSGSCSTRLMPHGWALRAPSWSAGSGP